MKKLIHFIEGRSENYILFFLSLFSFLESIIFPIPIDIFTLGLSSLRPRKWKSYFIYATVFSVLGAVTAYIIGEYFSHLAFSVIHFFHYDSYYEKVARLFHSSPFWLTFTSAFTPIPFKVFTLTAGITRAPFLPFLLASIVGRGLRFFIESYLGMRFGLEMAKRHMRRINIGLILLLLLFIIFYLIFR